MLIIAKLICMKIQMNKINYNAQYAMMDIICIQLQWSVLYVIIIGSIYYFFMVN